MEVLSIFVVAIVFMFSIVILLDMFKVRIVSNVKDTKPYDTRKAVYNSWVVVYGGKS